MKLVKVVSFLVVAVLLRFYLTGFMDAEFPTPLRMATIVVILGVGAGYVLRGTAKVIEETTDVLSQKTKLASGLLQSVGTAFPDMVIGVVAAVVSLRLRMTDYPLAINFAIIAAATTFGSNIYNIGHAAWCVFRQNLANGRNEIINMFPFLKGGGMVIPMQKHQQLPSVQELDTAMDVLNTLTILTSVVALSMVIFGRIGQPPVGTVGDLYQLVRPVGWLIIGLSVYILFHYRRTRRAESPVVEIEVEEKYYLKKPVIIIWIHLLISGVAILLGAESMVHAVQNFSEITGMPLVVAGTLTGIVGCLGEMIVVHNFTVNPKGRIGDALVGVAMDNIVTTLGAAVVAAMGGDIFRRKRFNLDFCADLDAQLSTTVADFSIEKLLYQ